MISANNTLNLDLQIFDYADKFRLNFTYNCKTYLAMLEKLAPLSPWKPNLSIIQNPNHSQPGVRNPNLPTNSKFRSPTLGVVVQHSLERFGLD